MSPPSPQEHIYSQFQTTAYLKHINFPQEKYPTISPNEAKTSSSLALPYLSALMRYHLLKVPFENLSLHYSRSRILSLEKQDLYEKIVGAGNGRGGYCMENNEFFGNVLRSLGFVVFSCGGRVYGPPDGDDVNDSNGVKQEENGVAVDAGFRFGGWAHQVSIVIIDEKAYLVDIGFATQNPTNPMLLEDGQMLHWGNTSAQNRLAYIPSPNPVIQGRWVLQYRISPSEPWKPLYTFSLTEFHPVDFEIMSYGTSTLKTMFFTYMILCTRVVLSEDGEEVIGTVILENGRLRRRIGNKTEDVAEWKSERERVEGLKEWFGITLSEKQRDAIKGTVTALR